MSTTTTPPVHAPSALLVRLFGSLANNPYYRLFWFGNQAHTIFVAMQSVANGYLAYTLTGSAAALGIVSLANSLPALLFSPIGGVFSDRLPKRTILICLQGFMCFQSVVLGTLVALGAVQYWHVVVFSIAASFNMAVMIPARQGWIPYLVTREDMPNAIAINNVGQNFGRIMGPTLGGILIAVPVIGLGGIYYFRILVLAWIMITLLQIPFKGEPEVTRKKGSLWEELTFGYRYIWHHETLTTLFSFALVIGLMGQAYQALIPAFALGVFHVGSKGQGLMQTAVGAGALTGSLAMAYVSRSPHKAKIQAYTGTLLGLAFVSFGISAVFAAYLPALLALFMVGFALDFNATINNTLILLNTEQALFGRIMGVYQMTVSVSPITAFGFGAAMDQVGGGPVMIAIGTMITLFVVLVSTFHPGYKVLRNTRT